MALQSSSDLLRGGLDIVTPAMALKPGMAIAALNYEPEVRGYRRIGGYERFNGLPSPSRGANQAEIAARRAAIGPVPGVGPVRGVTIYNGHIYAFRDAVGGGAGMWRSSMNGWTPVVLGHFINFTEGTQEFPEEGSLLAQTSGASATIRRVVLQSGQWDGTAAGYIVVANLLGSFQEEIGTGSAGGRAKVQPQNPVTLTPGGRYDFLVHNFYGANRTRRLYGVNGVGPGFEFDGDTLSPIRTGNGASTVADIVEIMTRDGSMITTRDGSTLIARAEADKPSHVAQHSNHLFLSFDAGSVIHSGVGEPLDFRVVAGAGEISFGVAPTGFLSSTATSLVIFAQSRIEYLVGSDSDTFDMKPITDAAGAARWSVQAAGEAPIYLDDGGLRRLTTSSAFGDWRMGTLSQLVEPLFRQKHEEGALVTASFVVKSKDQYRLFFNDGTSIVLYLGRKNPEIMPARYACGVFTACSGELREGAGERIFIGADDGFVYEVDSGTSFDGAPVPAYVRLAWNSLKAPMIEKRFQSARIETENRDPMEIGVVYHLDYTAGEDLAGELRAYATGAGSPDLTPAGDPYASVDWTIASAGEIRADDLSGLGRNIAITLISNHVHEKPHTLTAMTMFCAPRRSVR